MAAERIAPLVRRARAVTLTLDSDQSLALRRMRPSCISDEQLAAHNITLVLKPHPLAPIDLPVEGKGLRVLRQSDVEVSGVSLYEVLAAVDGLVTDASSVWIDYLLVGRPVIFVFPDMEQYRSQRGLNLRAL